MRTLAIAVSLALLLAPAVCRAEQLYATPELDTIPVLQDGRVVQIHPAGLVPLTMYTVKLCCLSGEQALLETEICVNAGYQAVIDNSSSRGSTKRFGSLIIVDPASGPGETTGVLILNPAMRRQPAMPKVGGGAPLTEQYVAPPAVTAAAQEFVLCGLRLTVYCPGADRFEARIERADQPAPKLLLYPGDLLPTYVYPPHGDFVYAGSLRAALDTPDVGWASVPEAARL